MSIVETEQPIRNWKNWNFAVDLMKKTFIGRNRGYHKEEKDRKSEVHIRYTEWAIGIMLWSNFSNMAQSTSLMIIIDLIFRPNNSNFHVRLFSFSSWNPNFE